jgi:hypothetical protein
VIPQDRLDKLADIIARARAAGNTEVVAKAAALLAQIIRQNAAEASEPDPMTRAHAKGTHQRARG